MGKFSINENSGVLTFTSAPDFEAKGSANNDNTYVVAVTASDGENSVSQMITVTVTDVNEFSPMITSNNAKSVAENATAVLTVTATDADATAMISYSLSGGSDRSSFSIDAVGGALTFNSAPDFEAPGSVDGDNTYVVQVTANDGTRDSSPQTITVTVTDANDNNPMITSGNTKSVAENTTAVLTVLATDADANTTFSYSLSGGSDRIKFSINENSGALTFTSAPDFEAKGSANNTNTYVVQVTAGDGVNTSNPQDITVTVTDENEAPVITSDNTKSVVEGTTTVLTVTATDADANTTLTYSVSGGADEDSFSVDAGSGDLTFRNAPDFEAPGSADNDNVYEVEVKASDGVNDVTQTITVTVTSDVLGVPSAEGVVLYPNPASGQFRLTGISDELIGVSLIGTAGHLVRSYPVSKDGLYDLSGLNEGLFFVVIEGVKERKAVGRIVIRK